MKKSHEHYFKDTWDEYLKKFPVIFKTSLLLQILPMIFGTIIMGITVALLFIGVGSGFSEAALSSLQTSQDFFNLIFNKISFAAIIPAAVVITVVALAMFALFLLSSIVHIKIALSEEKEVITFEKALKFAKENFWNYLGLAIVKSILLALLFLLLIIPGIIFLVYWIMAPYILLNEKKTISESLQESKKRVKDKWWPAFFHLLGGCLIIMGVTGILTFIIPLLGNLFSVIVAMPIFLIFLKNVYKGLSKKENFEDKKQDKSKKKSRKK